MYNIRKYKRERLCNQCRTDTYPGQRENEEGDSHESFNGG